MCRPRGAWVCPVAGSAMVRAVAFACAAAGLGIAGASETGPLQLTEPARPSAIARRLQLWVDLHLPPLAAADVRTPALRDAHARAIEAAQDDLAIRLQQLGAKELGRVRVVRNAIAVEADAALFERIRLLPGVRSVTPVRHAERDDRHPAGR